MPIPDLPDVAGHSLDGTTYVITPEENAVLCRSMGAEPDADGRAHPVYFYIASQVGMGLSVRELCAVCAFDVDDGPMMGGCDVKYFQPLETAQPYQVRGEIVGLTRKQSRKLGIMDLLEYRLHLDLPDGTRVLSTTNSWILPRGQADAN
ncbi:hypothetical protein ACQKGC_25030 [Allorhizobium pseudoryzae]|uniref:hypothetical protein n=1 Tax=Allorhizobium pseudoryzae TaxID=379684 RepID=UPI003CFDE589